MFNYFKHLILRNEIQRQFGFYADYRVCVMDLLEQSLNTHDTQHSDNNPISSKQSTMNLDPQIKSSLFRVIQSDWDSGVSAFKCRDDLLQKLRAKENLEAVAKTDRSLSDIAA